MKMIEDLGMLYPQETSRHRKHFGVFECPYCGQPFRAPIRDINNRYYKSCGCLRKSKGLFMRKHGKTGTRLYNIYNNMRHRCYWKTHKAYKYYGGKGVIICDEWYNDFMSFYTWCLNNGYDDNLQIDRIDCNGNYSPENCRWISACANMQNTSKRKDNTSGYRGVEFCHGSWHTRIRSNNVRYYLGCYTAKEEAAKAYNDWVIKHKTSHQLNVV